MLDKFNPERNQAECIHLDNLDIIPVLVQNPAQLMYDGRLLKTAILNI